jgi:hypothetical protein
MISDKTMNEMENANGMDKYEKGPGMDPQALQKDRGSIPLAADVAKDAEETSEQEKSGPVQNHYEPVS